MCPWVGIQASPVYARGSGDGSLNREQDVHESGSPSGSRKRLHHSGTKDMCLGKTVFLASVASNGRCAWLAFTCTVHDKVPCGHGD
eukprot:8023300-Alexandrium_andersonii.AAC.1